MTKREPRPVRGWAAYLSDGNVWADNVNDHLKVRVHIAPVATHAVVELAKVDTWLACTSKNGNSQGRRLLEELGLLPAKKPRKPLKCSECGGRGEMSVGGVDHIACWKCVRNLEPKRRSGT